MLCWKPSERPWINIAKGEISIEEIPGPQHHSRILEYHEATSTLISDDETPWCSAFVNWCMKKAGYSGTDSPVARSWNNWGKGIPSPKYGCVAVFWREDIKGWKGHVGFYVAHDSDQIIVLGGNQNNKVGLKGYPHKQLLGYRWPTNKESVL